MSKNGYGQTLVVTPLGTLTSLLKSVTSPGLTIRTERVRRTADTYREGTAEVLDATHGNLVATLDWDKSLHDAAWDAAEARTLQSLTYTDAEGSVCAGACYVTNVSEIEEGTDAESEFKITFEPQSRWTRTPAA